MCTLKICFAYWEIKKNESQSQITHLRTFASSKDSDQPAHSCSPIRIFTGHILDSQDCKVSSCGQQRLWSDALMRWLIWVFIGAHVRRSVSSLWGSLMTDSICHSLLPRTVLEKVTLTTIPFYIYLRTKVDPMFQCVYISTPLKSCPYKSSATCAWSMARVAEKTHLNICENNKGTDQSVHLRRLISAFVVRYSLFFSKKTCLTNLNGKQKDTGNLLVFHRICHFRAIQPFDLYM